MPTVYRQLYFTILKYGDKIMVVDGKATVERANGNKMTVCSVVFPTAYDFILKYAINRK